MKPRLSLIAAMTEARVIGVDGHLPWHIPEDLKRFKEITAGHPVIMGRKTYVSIGRLLPKRTNVIVTRSSDLRVEGALVCRSLDDALAMAASAPGGEEIFVIGGAELYRLALPRADRLYLTEIRWPFEGDTFFPEVPAKEFREITRETISREPEAVLRILDRAGPQVFR